MRVLVIGATGVLGRPLVPLLAASGREVIATSRNIRGEAGAEHPGITATRLDVLDAEAVRRAVRDQAPDAIVHVATAIPAQIDPKRIDRQFVLTNRIRTEGTRNLLDAADRAGVARVVAQGVAFAYEPGEGVRTESDPLWASPPRPFLPLVAALADLEQQTTGAGGTVLRFGHLYGPGTSYAPDGWVTGMVRAGRYPLVGRGAARYSFTHVDDAASAVLAALDRSPGGVFNIVDDEPVYVREWLPWFAEFLGARAPRRIPALLARLVIGPYGVAFTNGLAAASNARARRELHWQPRHQRFADGIAADFRQSSAATAGN